VGPGLFIGDSGVLLILSMRNFEESFQEIVQSVHSKKAAPKKLNQKLIDGVLSLVLQSDNNQDLQILDEFFDNYLWLLFTDNSTDSHVVLIAAALQAKLASGNVLSIDDTEKLHCYLVRLIRIFGKEDTSYRMKSLCAKAITTLVLCLENPAVRKATSPFVSILTWGKLPNLTQLLKNYELEDHYNKQLTKLENLAQKERFEQLLLVNWIPSLIIDVVSNITTGEPDFINYVTDVNVLLTRLLGQLPTRRFMRTVILQSHFVPIARSIDVSHSYNSSLDLLELYLKFPINEFTGDILNPESLIKMNSDNYLKFQAVLFNMFKDRLEDLAFATHESLKDQQETADSLSQLDDTELESLAASFGFTLELVDHQYKIKALLFQLEAFQSCSQLLSSVNSLSETSLVSKFDVSTSSLPSLKGQYLSISDFLCRNYLLLRNDSFSAIAQHVIRTVGRFEYKKDKSKNKLSGTSKHAVKIHPTKFSAHTPRSIKSADTVEVIGDIKIDLINSSPVAVQEWNALDKRDVLLLLTVDSRQPKSSQEFEKLGISTLRAAVIQDKGNNTTDASNKVSKTFNLKVLLDAKAFVNNNDTLEDYEKFNLVVKLPSHLSKYYTKLDKISEIVNSTEDNVVEWLYESFLGFGDANSGTFRNVEQSIESLTLSIPGQTSDSIKCSFPEVSIKDKEYQEPDTKRRKTISKNTRTFEKATSLIFEVNGKQIRFQNINESSSTMKLNSEQVRAVTASLFEGLVVVNGASGTGKKSVVAQIINGWLKNFEGERTLIVCKSAAHLKYVFQILSEIGIADEELFNVSDKGSQTDKATAITKKLLSCLNQVDKLATCLGIEGAYGDNVENARYFYKYYIEAPFLKYIKTVKEKWSVDAVREDYPFCKIIGFKEYDGVLVDDCFANIREHYNSIVKLFTDIEALASFESLQSTKDKIEHLFSIQAKIIGVTIDEFVDSAKDFKKAGIHFQNMIISEASQLTQLEALFPVLLQNSSTKRIVLLGDSETYMPTTNSPKLGSYTHLITSLITRFQNSGTEVITFNEQYNKRTGITQVLNKTYPNLKNSSTPESQQANAGLLNSIQFVQVDSEEIQPVPEVYQNVKEAEYAIQMYQYLRLLAYPSYTISILTPEEGQRSLLHEIATTKCGNSKASDEAADFKFGLPKVSTIEEFRGQESDIIIVSLVRSSELDDRQITSALSASKTGFYVLGLPKALEHINKSENYRTLKGIVESTETHKLQIVVGEMYFGVKRKTSDTIDSFTMENLEHFGEFVSQMTEKRLSAGKK